MNIIVLNISMLLAWLMIFAGSWVAWGLGIGLIVGGVLLVLLTFVLARAVGGFYSSKPGEPG